MALQAGLAGASALIGLLGKKKNYNSAADLAAGRSNLTKLQAVGGQQGALADQAAGDYGADNAGYRQALGNEEQYLETDPYTSQEDAADLSQATSGLEQGYQTGESSLSASLAKRGITDSSEAAGGQMALERARAGALGGAANNLAYQKIAKRQSNAQGLLSLMGGAANQDYGRQTSALGAEGNVDSNLASTELNLGEREQGLEDASNSGLDSALGAAGGAIGGVAAGSFDPNAYMKLLLKQRQAGQPAGTQTGGSVLPGFNVGGSPRVIG